MTARTVVRAISWALALGLVAWALADDDWIGGGAGFGLVQGLVLGTGALLGASTFASLGANGRVLALVVSALLVGTVAEIGLEATVGPRFRGVSQFDADAIYSFVPGARRVYVRQAINGGDAIAYRINTEGYRGEELEPDPAFRIVLYGDSFIHAEFSRTENTFAERLEHHIQARSGVTVEVVNSGVAGYGPDQALRRMERELAWLEPDLVLMAIFSGNDFGDLMRNKLYRLAPDGSLVANPVNLDPSLKRLLEVQRNELVLKRILRQAAKRLLERVGLRKPKTDHVESLPAAERTDYFIAQHVREYEEYLVKGDPVIRELSWDSYDADVVLLPDSESTQARVALMNAVVGRMGALTRSLDAPLVVMPIPHPTDLGGHDTVAIDPERHASYVPRRLVDVLEGIAREHGVPAIDLFDPLQSRGTEGLFFEGGDDHWNDAGQDLAAEIAAGFLADAGLLPGTRR